MKVQKEWINQVVVFDRFRGKEKVYSHQESYGFSPSPQPDDMSKSKALGEEFIKVPSDEHKEILVRIDDIISVQVVKNPDYETEDGEDE